MLLPLGDEPNPHGVPWVTYALIALNTAVYVLISLPLSFAQPNFNDPVLLEYVSVLVDQLPQEWSQAEILARISAYDSSRSTTASGRPSPYRSRY